MRILNSRILFLLVILFIVTPVGLAQQKRSPAKPVKKVAPPSAVSNPPTFDTLLGADSYKVYGEIRGVGQFIRSNSVNELLEPILKLAGPPKEFRALIKWLNVHADDVMTSRMLVGLWPTAKNIPDVLVAIEFASPEEAAKFEPQLNTFLPKLLPPEAPQVSEGGETKPTAPVAPKPSYYLKQSASLILVTPTPLTIKNLKPAGSKMLSDDPSFRVARTRFTSEQVFVFLDVNAIEAVGYHLTSRAVQFRGKFGAGCSGPDDRDMQLSRSYWIGLSVGTDKAVNEPLNLELWPPLDQRRGSGHQAQQARRRFGASRRGLGSNPGARCSKSQ